MNGVRFWCYHAGHVLGAAMVMMEIAGVKILYTGDFSRVEDRHLMAAEIPSVSPDLLITVSDVMVMSLLVREGSNGKVVVCIYLHGVIFSIAFNYFSLQSVFIVLLFL